MNKLNIKQDKLNALLKSPNNLFYTKDLSLLWGVANKNTLYTTIKRYIRKGILLRIKKGFYSKVPLNEIDPIKLGMAFLHSFCYLSTETILFQKGVISQPVSFITLISDKSQKFKIKDNSYLSRQLKDRFLFNETGIEKKNGIKQASLERAVADMLYFNPSYYFDVPNLINWKKVKEIRKIIGYK